MKTYDLVLCLSDMGDGGWSLHAPSSTDEDIAAGIALPLLSGYGYPKCPSEKDYKTAKQKLP